MGLEDKEILEEPTPAEIADACKSKLSAEDCGEIRQADPEEAYDLAVGFLRDNGVEDAYAFFIAAGLFEAEDEKASVGDYIPEQKEKEQAFRRQLHDACTGVLPPNQLESILIGEMSWPDEPAPPQEDLLYRIVVKFWLPNAGQKDGAGFLESKGIASRAMPEPS